ncbi:helix-turn-helix domain-containing protein [Meiothermus granaticius]|uniref:HTH-type transcriptional regulator Xre n=1 Tax=Meiothermus granaticius NBRC 107808 TaxID=1227551 RepID=A0A399FBE2_9DEIN|nr:helix-turn-helix transcriptional regulator [Meiothermus granaticius]MCL6527342.1 helix-turn-helix domain-containing protein [Thermaceae bacterium]RIH93463.1 HTH-type transcriptional regulator Xre [Meiothermus granaticius NBRC 107808]GEM85956.1 hypothetical protein MGR01S_05810 [Meiothermus granaticius NBRC 107808]
MKGVATNLRRCRLALGITQEELEARSGVAQANISLYENGRINPNLRNLRRLARALEVPVDALLTESKKDPDEMPYPR